VTAIVVGPLPSGEFAVRDTRGTFGLYPKAPGPLPELTAVRYCAALTLARHVEVHAADGWKTGAWSHTINVPADWIAPVPLSFRPSSEHYMQVQRL
jgi:hypothetical protein